jgi:hypothetical protein
MHISKSRVIVFLLAISCLMIFPMSSALANRTDPALLQSFHVDKSTASEMATSGAYAAISPLTRRPRPSATSTPTRTSTLPPPTSTPTNTFTNTPTNTPVPTTPPSSTPVPSATATATPPSAAGRVYGLVGQGHTYETLDTGLLQQQYDAGVRVRLLEPEWDAFQRGGPLEWNQDAVAAMQRKIDTFVSYGPDVKLVLDLGVQYAPTWVSSIDPLVDQYGTTWVDPRGGVNVYWSPRVRSHVSHYISRLFTTLNFRGRLWNVRVGPLGGEMMYPNVHHPDRPESFWAFDSNAQAQSPVPGWRPGQPSPNGEAERFYYWYTDNLAATFNWFLSEIRRSHSGFVSPVTPGGGMWPLAVDQLIRSNLTTTDPWWYGTGNYWYRIFPLMGVGDQMVMHWCSSVGDGFGNDNDMFWWGWSSMKQQAWMAAEHKRPIYAENVGRNPFDTSGGADPRVTMRWIFESADAYDYAGIMWVRQADMLRPEYASLAQYAYMISLYP